MLLKELNETKEKWVNPCGINFNTLINLTHTDSDYIYEPLTDAELLQQVTIQVSKALRQSRRFKEDYVSTFCHYIKSQQLVDKFRCINVP